MAEIGAADILALVGAAGIDVAIDVTKLIVGAPCKRCGCQERWLVNRACVECTKTRQRSPAQRARCAAWYAENKERHKGMRDEWREENRKEVRTYNDKWRRENLARMCAHVQAYNAQKLRAMPAWADREAIQRIYENCPPDNQVDHIIPLRGKIVSGLHVEINLQYLPGVENNRKGNRHAA
jgi:hypothetical protein